MIRRLTRLAGQKQKSSSKLSVTASIFSLPADVINGQLSVTLKGNTHNQIIKDGNFPTGTIEWNNATGATLSVTNNTLSIIGNGGSSLPRTYQQTNLPATSGKKIFFKVKIKVTNSNALTLGVAISDTNGVNLGITGINGVSSPTINQEYVVSFIASAQAGLTGNLRLLLNHQYADATTANGKVMEVKEAHAYDLTAEYGAGNEPDLATCDKMFATWQAYGVKSTNSVRVKSVGKNSINLQQIIQNGCESPLDTLSTTDGKSLTISSTNASWHNPILKTYIPVIAGINYCINITGTEDGTGVICYDSNKQQISTISLRWTKTFIAPVNSAYVKIQFMAIQNVVRVFTDFQLEKGTVATAFESYQETSVVTPAIGGSLGIVKDEYSANDGVATQKRKDYVLQSADITTLNTSPVNVDYVNISRASMANIYAQLAGITPNKMIFPKFSPCPVVSGTDNISYAWTYIDSLSFSTSIILIVPKGTYADLASTKTALTGTSVSYQLATPLTTQPGAIITDETGAEVEIMRTYAGNTTVIVEPVGDITLSTLPDVEYDYSIV